MKYLPVRCRLHGWLLLDSESVGQGKDDLVIACEGHFFSKNVCGGAALIETTQYPPKTRGLTDAEYEALKRKDEKVSRKFEERSRIMRKRQQGKKHKSTGGTVWPFPF